MNFKKFGSGRLISAVALGVVVLSFASCNKSPVKLNPVHGQVFFKEQPAEGAQIVFRPAEEPADAPAPPMAYGTVAKDGSFTLRTEPYGEGAPAGDYVVLMTWYDTDPRDPERHFNKLPAKYADQSNPVLKVTVKEGKNELEPFRLKS